MPKSSKTTRRVRKPPTALPQKTRLWLMFPPRLIRTPVIWQLSQKFKLVTNIRQASVTDEIGVVCLELEGARADIKSSIKWLERMGIRVEPVEINVIES
ncbi:MAG: ferredoxin [Verrucomicrobia bacterium]|nr:ferredoxin [Verrucomicrobiota bacterium]